MNMRSVVVIFIILMGSCSSVFFGVSHVRAQEPCQVFRVTMTPAGAQPSRYFETGANHPPVSLVVKTQNCNGQTIKYWINARLGMGGPTDTVKPLAHFGEAGKSITITDKEAFSGIFSAGEEFCWNQRVEELAKKLTYLPVDRKTQLINQFFADYIGTKVTADSADSKTVRSVLEGGVGTLDDIRDHRPDIAEIFDAAAKDMVVNTPEIRSYDCNYEVFIDTNPSANTPYDQVPNYSAAGGSIRYMCSVETNEAVEPYTGYGQNVNTSKYIKQNDCIAKWSTLVGVTANVAPSNASGLCLNQTTGEEIPGCYELLAPMPGFDPVIYFADPDGAGPLEPYTLGDYFDAAISVLIGATSLFAVVFLVYAGFMYTMSSKSGSVVNLSRAKEKLKDVAIGSGVILISYILLSTINPDLLFIDPSIEPVYIDGEIDSAKDSDFAPGGRFEDFVLIKDQIGKKRNRINLDSSAQKNSAVASIDMSKLSDLSAMGIVIKSGAGKYIDPLMANKLKKINEELKSQGITMRVTEGFKPTSYAHRSGCHYLATCIDASFDNLDPARIKKFLTITNSNGVLAIFEVKGQARKKELVATGIPAEYVAAVSYITGEHFSVYDLAQ